jgi:hypothetical protein
MLRHENHLQEIVLCGIRTGTLLAVQSMVSAHLK